MTDVPDLADHPADDADAVLVRLRATVRGTPEEVWWSVATGAGIGTWYVPAKVQSRVGGAVVTDHGPFGHSHGVVTAYDPPRRFAYEERAWGQEVPPWRTEVLVEPGPGGVCEVRLTSGLTTDGPRYRDAIGLTEEAWVAGLRNLRLAREHFPGQEAGGVFVVRGVRAPQGEAWAALLRALGLADAVVGDEVAATEGAPALAGVVEEVRPTSLLLRTTAPAPGFVELSAHTWTTTSLLVHAHLFGPAGSAVAEAERPRWDAWLHARFPGAKPT
ncbi:SRPBCC family protein [Patulibacter minatonensis]|uniref:SRPBCC family protein n=1 Tax=Patulibacter minatonensis TaxID=298163 RepID=UPI00146FC368|nr:SRPBCC domain-containing protein [Patulibacter minatonensis]